MSIITETPGRNPDRAELLEVYTRPAAKLTAATIWLHGQGANAEDLNPILVNLRRSRELGLHWLAPSAPLRRMTVNDGRPARAWYDIPKEPDAVDADRDGIEQSSKRMHDLLDARIASGMPARRIVLGGFSQGGSLALHAGLGYSRALGGIIVLSGELLLAGTLDSLRSAASLETPILLLHGSDDPVVPISAAQAGRDRLDALGYSVAWHEFPIEHTVSVEQVELLDGWMFQRLSA